ncbi:hypothetical protein VPH35_028156 [Triticum aestivum]
MASNAQFLAVILLHLCTTSSSLYLGPPRQAHDYLRFADVNRHCQSVLSSPEAPAILREGRLAPGRRPCASPAVRRRDAPKMGACSRRLPEPLSRQRWVLAVASCLSPCPSQHSLSRMSTMTRSTVHRARPAVNVSGVLVLALAWKTAAPEFGPGMSAVSPDAESNGDDDGERVLCMVGSAVLPKRSTGGVDPWDWAKNSGRSSFQSPVTADNNILLVLRYSKKLTLTIRATLSAEGAWNASTGQERRRATSGSIQRTIPPNLPLSLLTPTTMSINRLDTMLGQITGVDAAAGGVAHPPLPSFRQHMSPPRLWGYHPDDGIPRVYNYTKVNQAGELRRRSELPSDFRKTLAKSLSLSYPKRDGAGNDRRSLSSLADRLTLWFMAVPDLFRQDWIEHPILHLEVFSLEQVIDRYSPPQHGDGIPTKKPGTERRILLNMSAELTIFKDRWSQKSVMSLEGVYNPDDGRMHLIGCRNVRLPQQNSSTSRDLGLEEGMDCSIEVKVDYPPTTMHLFVMSTAKVQIVSTRTAQRPSGFYRGVVNGVLRIVLLAATIAAVLSQLRYIKTHTDVAPYISLVMLSVQALGYGIPLVTGVEAILARVTLRSSGDLAKSTSSKRTPYYMFDTGRPWLQRTIDQAVKVLTGCAFILTVRLGQKVRCSRARMVERSPLDPACVPSDGRVFVYHCGLHLALFVLVLALNREAMTVQQQVALMQDLFLLPQAIGNAVWRVHEPFLKSMVRIVLKSIHLGH